MSKEPSLVIRQAAEPAGHDLSGMSERRQRKRNMTKFRGGTVGGFFTWGKLELMQDCDHHFTLHNSHLQCKLIWLIYNELSLAHLALVIHLVT